MQTIVDGLWCLIVLSLCLTEASILKFFLWKNVFVINFSHPYDALATRKEKKEKIYTISPPRSPIYHIFIHFIVQNLVIGAELAQKYHTINGHSAQLQYYYTPQTLGDIMWMTRIKIIFPNVLWSQLCPHNQIFANEMAMEVGGIVKFWGFS